MPRRKAATMAGATSTLLDQAVKQLQKLAIKQVEKKAVQGAKRIANKAKNYMSQSQTETVNAKSVKREPKLKYRTTGHLQGKLVHKKHNEDLSYQKKGIVFRQESGGVISDNDAIYIGHSTCLSQSTLQTVFRVLVKRLWQRVGIDVSNLEQVPQMEAAPFIQIDYRTDPSSTSAWLNTGVNVAVLSYEAQASALRAQVTSIIGVARPYEFGFLRLFRTLGDNMPIAQIDLRQMLLDFDIDSVLKVQNTTLANAVTEDANKDTTEDIENNPVTGYIYSNVGKWSNSLQYQDGRRSNAPLPNGLPVLVANNQTGVISFVSSADPTSVLKKPPHKAFQFGCKNQGLVNLEPGAIKYSKLKFKSSMYFNTFMSKFADVLYLPTGTYKMDFGNVALIGLEKYLASRAANASQVRVAYQIDNTIRCAATMKHNPYTTEIKEIL